jgi:hypothetical protein
MLDVVFESLVTKSAHPIVEQTSTRIRKLLIFLVSAEPFESL